MRNILDLRKKIQPQVVVIERMIMKRQAWYFELVKISIVVVIVSAIVWGVSKASDVLLATHIDNFSAIGTVSEITDATISLINAQGSDKSHDASYVIDATGAQLLSKSYALLGLSDIAIGDRISVQGELDGSSIAAKRIISFTATSSAEKELPVTASSTDATSTPDVVADPVVPTPEATSTPDVTATTTPVVDDVATTTPITDTATTTPDTTATTTEQITEPVATTTPDISTEPVPTETAPTSTEEASSTVLN